MRMGAIKKPARSGHKRVLIGTIGGSISDFAFFKFPISISNFQFSISNLQSNPCSKQIENWKLKIWGGIELI